MASPYWIYPADDESPTWYPTGLLGQGNNANNSSAETSDRTTLINDRHASAISVPQSLTDADWDAFLTELLSEHDRTPRLDHAHGPRQISNALSHWNLSMPASTMTGNDTVSTAWPQRGPAQQRSIVDSHPLSTLSDEGATLSRSAENLAQLFLALPEARSNPPSNGDVLRQQKLRFDDDLYTTRWTRGEGPDREGWCTYCASWWRLKDSAYWYHLQYSHGVSCLTGQCFAPPIALRASQKANDLEVLCPSCRLWINIGKDAKIRTTYFRHAYRCQGQKHNSSLPPAKSPRKTAELPRQ